MENNEYQMPNIMTFSFEDNKNINKYNESCSMEKRWYVKNNDEAMDIETYYCFCKEFAAAMGFCEKTIEQWFGRY